MQRIKKKGDKPRVGRGRRTVKKGAAGVFVTRRLERPALSGGSALPWFARIFDADRIAAKRLAAELRLTKDQLAEAVGVSKASLQRAARANSPKTQARLRETSEIINRVSAWAGGRMQAVAWYRGEPIPSFGGRTAESLVKEGKAAAVRDYLDRVALGGFA